MIKALWLMCEVMVRFLIPDPQVPQASHPVLGSTVTLGGQHGVCPYKAWRRRSQMIENWTETDLLYLLKEGWGHTKECASPWRRCLEWVIRFPHLSQPQHWSTGTSREVPHHLHRNYLLFLRLFPSQSSSCLDGGRGFLEARVPSFAFRYISSMAIFLAGWAVPFYLPSPFSWCGLVIFMWKFLGRMPMPE